MVYGVSIVVMSSVMLLVLMTGCGLPGVDGSGVSSQNIPAPPAPNENGFSMTAVQEYDPDSCSSRGELIGGYAGLGIMLQPYDADSGQLIPDPRGSVNFPEQRGGMSAGPFGFTCVLTDPTFPVTVSLDAKGYIPIKELSIGALPVGKMYLIKVPMEQKPACYYDAERIERFHEFIDEDFGLDQELYAIECMDSDITRGGFIESTGTLNQGGTFALSYGWGWCSSGGTGCGWTKCYSVEGNDELFQTVKTHICDGVSSKGHHDDTFCSSPEYDDTAEIRQKCLDGAYDYSAGRVKTISVIQESGRCSSTVAKGGSDCLSIR